MTVLRILFAAAFIWFVCLSSGQLLFRMLKLNFPRGERTFLAFVTGAALVSTTMFALASIDLVYTALLVVGGLAVVAAWVRFCKPDFRNLKGFGPRLPFFWKILFWAPLLVYGVLYLFTAMAPETDADGTLYHVGLITRFYDHRGFFPVHTLMYAGLGEGIEMLFWIGFALGRHSAAAMVELLFLLAMPFGMLAFGERIQSPRAGVVGALLFYIAPVVGRDGTIGYIDVATAVVVFGTFYFLQIWRDRNDPNDKTRILAIAGLMAGFCYACKITAATAVIYAVVLVLVVSARRSGMKAAVRATTVVVLFACVTAVPWMVKDVIEFHNPFYPLFNRWFPNPYEYEMVEADLRRLMAHVNDVPYSQIPYQLTAGGKLVGIIGPVFLLVPVALLSLARPAGRQLLLAFIPVFLPFFSNTGARFFIPALPFLSLAFAIALVEIPRIGTAVAVLAVAFHAWISWPGEIEKIVPGFQWRIGPLNLPAALRVVPEKKFLEENWPDYRAGELLDRMVPPGDLVFSPSMGQLAYHHRQIIGPFECALGKRAWNTFITPTKREWSTEWHRDIRFAAVTTTRFRLQAGTAMDNELRISEIRFFDRNREIDRKPGWRLTASRNPWEVQLAFDNDPWSWWTSGAAVDQKTWIEAGFGEPVQIDRITVDQIEDQRWVSLLPVADLAGVWTAVKATETDSSSLPAADFRMELKDELQSMGFRWILIADGTLGADDLRTKSPEWGVQQIAEVNGYRLWKLR